MITVKNEVLIYNDTFYKCAIGKNGLTDSKMEGDNCTPIGTYSIDIVYYRKDKFNLPIINFPKIPIKNNFGWCDDANSPDYNKFITFPFQGSAENLYREDNIYDIVCILDYNTKPIIKNRGSAIFLHVANEDYSGTAGCIALSKKDLIELLENINPKEKIHVIV